MFEDAMMESSGRMTTGSRYYTTVGALLNGAVVGALILMPLLYPEALPKNAVSMTLVAPPPPPAPVPVERVQRPAPTMPEPVLQMEVPTRIPKQISMKPEGAPPSVPGEVPSGLSGNAPGVPGGLFSTFGSGQPVVVRPSAPRKIAVSQGVMAGNLLVKPEPAYPAIAKAARVQGTVTLAATISKTGTIENLTVVSGPAMLAQAAVEAVQRWRYRPFLLNGEPVEVQTSVTVSFLLGN